VKKLLCAAAVAAIVAGALPAWSQIHQMQGQSVQQSPPGTGGTSKAGVPGLPGSKSGPTVTPSGNTLPQTKSYQSGDQSGVKGLPGNKSGPAERPSALGR
jgi:hypothetical protein